MHCFFEKNIPYMTFPAYIFQSDLNQLVLLLSNIKRVKEAVGNQLLK